MTVILSLGVLLMVVAGMAIGVMMGRKPIAGSCGGLNAVGIDGDCKICGGNSSKCESIADNASANSFAMNAGSAKKGK